MRMSGTAALICMLLTAGTASAQVSTQWNFDGDLSSFFGNAALDYNSPPTRDKVTFGDAASLAGPTPDGGNPNVIAIDYFPDSDDALICRHDAPAGGGVFVNEYTLIWDVYIPQSSFDNYQYLGLYNTNCCNGNDADHFVRLSDGGFGVDDLGFAGRIDPDTWHRLAVTFEVEGGSVTHRRYIDGVLVATEVTDIDGRFSIYPASDPNNPWFHILADNNGEMAPAVFSSIYFADWAWAPAQFETLGCVNANGATSPGPDCAGGGPGSVQIIKGPYVQNMTQDAVTIMWETDLTADSTVHYLAGGQWLSDSGPGGRTIHEIRISGFSPSEEIVYYVESTADGGGNPTQSSQATIHTAPPTGTPFRMCVWGDNQDRPWIFSQHIERMIVDQPDLLLACGDVVSTGSIYEQWEDRFLGPLRPLIQYTPMIVAIGNHEQNSHWFYDFLDQPGNEHWFSYIYGNAFFLILDTNFPFHVGSEQYQFAFDALLSDEAQDATWLFAAHHHPGYSEVWEENTYAQIRRHLIPLYESAGVDVNFHGHIHDYERGEYVPPETERRIWQVQTSGAGGTLWWDGFEGEWDQIDLVIMDTYHYCVVDVGETELTLRSIDIDGNEIDTFTIQAEPRDGGPPGGGNQDPGGPSQWDFTDADLAPSYGPGTIEFYDGPNGATAQQTDFGTTTSLGIPDIDGEPADVMGFPKAVVETMGFRVRPDAPANAGGIYVNKYTLMFDMLIPQSTFISDDWLPFHNTTAANLNDADAFVLLANGGIGISGQYDGRLLADTWHRIALVFDVTSEVELIKYIDGFEVGRQSLGGIDGRWSLYSNIDGTPWFFLFTDDSGDAASAYVSSVHFTDRALTGAEIATLGEPDADGIMNSPCDPCDMNCDGQVDAFDIEPFLGLLFGGGVPCDACTGDADGDGSVDAFDIEPFLECLF